MSGYLFAHFIGEEKDGEQIYFAFSRDGLFWKDLNGGKPALFSRSGEKGVRDPFLIRDEKKGKYYMIATDLRIEAGKGWEAAQENGSLDLIVWESEDLIHWSEERSRTVGISGAGCVWAPEAVYDEEKGAFLVFWASRLRLQGEEKAKHRIYASYTADFDTFSEPFIFLEREQDVIDTTILKQGDKYFRLSKDESDSHIIMESCNSLTGEYRQIRSGFLDRLSGVEGPEGYLLPDGKTWCVIVDRFREGKGYLPMLAEDLEKGEFSVVDEQDFDFGKNRKRHGGVLRLNEEEARRVLEALGGGE